MKIATKMKLTHVNLFILVILFGVCRGDGGCSGDQNLTISHYDPDGKIKTDYTCASIIADWPYYCVENNTTDKWQPSGGQAAYPYQICCASCAAIPPAVLSCTNHPVLLRAGNLTVTCKLLVAIVGCSYSELLHNYCCGSCPNVIPSSPQKSPAGQSAGDNPATEPPPPPPEELPSKNLGPSPAEQVVSTPAPTCSNTITAATPFTDDLGKVYISCRLFFMSPPNLAYCSRPQMNNTLCCRTCKCVDVNCKDNPTYQFTFNGNPNVNCSTIITWSSVTRQQNACATPGVTTGCCATCAVVGGILSNCVNAG